MAFRIGSGYPAVTFEFGKPKYTKHQDLEQIADSKIQKRETEPPETSWICYSYIIPENKEVANIRGYFIGGKRFHIQRIKNLLKDKRGGHKYIPKIFEIMIRDLKQQGVEEITASALYKLASIIMKRYGFHCLNGREYKHLKKSLLRKIPILWTKLKMELK